MKKKLRSEFNSRQYMLSHEFEVFYYSDLHFSSVGRHSHAYTEVYLFCEGAVDMEIAGQSRTLQPGDVLVLPPGTVHQATVRNNEKPYRRFVFWLSEDYCRTLRAESPDYLYLFDRVRMKKDYVYPMGELEFNGLRSQLFVLLEELHTDRFGRDAQIALHVRDMLLSLNRIVWQKEHQKTKKGTRSGYQRITDYIRDNLGGDLSLDALSQSLFLSKYYIAHLFQEKTGLSIHQYITKKRLAACVEAMQSGQRVSEVYARLGFLNYSSFYRAFLKEYGCPPSVYLQEHLAPTAAETQAPE